MFTPTQGSVFDFWLSLYAHRHRSMLGAADHIILTPAMVMGLKIWTLSNPGSIQGPFDHWPSALTNCANRAKQDSNFQESYENTSYNPLHRIQFSVDTPIRANP
jgi:hypothetical protein